MIYLINDTCTWKASIETQDDRKRTFRYAGVPILQLRRYINVQRLLTSP